MVSLTEVEMMFAGALAALLVISFVLVFKIWALSKKDSTRETNEKLLEVRTVLSQLIDQSAIREQALRSEMKTNRDELGQAVTQLSDTVRKLGQDQSNAQEQFRDKLDEKMVELRKENSLKLEEMRKTVDEKLQTTLERRLSESFKTVSERLEAVQRGLGEMQTLATGVGDLKRVLTNVRSRGAFGEVQLGMLIEDMLAPGQFIENYDCGRGGSQLRVEFGIKMPGSDTASFLPVDAKFPSEAFERLMDATESGDVAGVKAAQIELSRAVRGFAKDIAEKYINPPHTTPNAILFLPTEGLYAEILRVPGFVEEIQNKFGVTVTGPTNFHALLTTFRVGYQQAKMQEGAVEVLRVLGAVKTEFGKYGDHITKMTKSIRALENHVDQLETRKNQMLRALKTVEQVEDGSTQQDLLSE